MKTRILHQSARLALGLSTSTLFATPSPLFTDLEHYVTSTMQLLAPSSAAIVVSRGDEVIFETYLPGNSTGLPSTTVDKHSLWALASVTKSFSSGVLLSLVEQGVLTLDDPVAKHLPAFRTPGAGEFDRTEVRIRHLAAHTSGLQFPDNQHHGDLIDLAVVSAPGAVFRYSATGMFVLQRVLEAATGEDFTALLQRVVLDPLDLNQTRYVTDFTADLPLMGTRAGDFADPTQHYLTTDAEDRVGSGLYSTAREVNRYAQLWALGGTRAGTRFFAPDLLATAAAAHAHFDYADANYGLLWWTFPERHAIVMSGASHSVSAISLAHRVVVTVMRNYIGSIPDGFVFHRDKEKLVDFAIALGESADRP